MVLHVFYDDGFRHGTDRSTARLGFCSTRFAPKVNGLSTVRQHFAHRRSRLLLRVHDCFTLSARTGQSKKDKRDQKSSGRRESGKSSRRIRHSKEANSSSSSDDDDDDNNDNKAEERREISKSRPSRRGHKKKRGKSRKHSERNRASERGAKSDSKDNKTRRSSSSSSSSGSDTSDSGDEVGPNPSLVASDLRKGVLGPARPECAVDMGGLVAGGKADTALEGARVPLQRLRGLIEEKLRAKARGGDTAVKTENGAYAGDKSDVAES